MEALTITVHVTINCLRNIEFAYNSGELINNSHVLTSFVKMTNLLHQKEKIITIVIYKIYLCRVKEDK